MLGLGRVKVDGAIYATGQKKGAGSAALSPSSSGL